MELPFAVGSSPRRLDNRDAVATYVAGYNDLVRPLEVVSETRQDTGDPDTVIIEFGVAGEAVSTGKPYQLDYIAW